MSTRPLSSEEKQMRARAKKPVTHGELAVMLSRWAQSADAAWSVKLHNLRMEIRNDVMTELGVTISPEERAGNEAAARELAELERTVLPFNPRMHMGEPVSVPTDSEGPE